MIGRMLNHHGALLRGLKLFKYQKLSPNLKYYLASDTSYSSNLPPIRKISNLNSRYRSAKSIRLQTSFGIPPSYEEIYVSHEYHTIMQHLFTFTATGVTIFGAIQLFINYEIHFPDSFTTALNLWVISVFYWCSIWSAVLGYRTPLRIYFNKETGLYKAVFNGILPTKHRMLEFKKGSVIQILPGDEFTLFKNSKFTLQGNRIYMFLDFFRCPGDFYNMFHRIEHE